MTPRQRLSYLANVVLPDVDPSKFDIEYWECRTTACAIGHATGAFDRARHQRIARAQAKVLRSLFPAYPPEHAEPPPAYVRPNEIPSREEMPFHYSLADLLQSLEGSAA